MNTDETRSAERGTRNRPGTVLFRVPRSAFALLVLCCTPATTRPPFAPYPEALRAVINAPPPRVVEEARAWLIADSVAVRFASPRDAFLETAELPGEVTLRVWADPDVPGKARVAIEAVYRPTEDPSREPRDLERAVPADSDGQRLADRLMAALVEKFGVTKY
jgi:hypothetical protein